MCEGENRIGFFRVGGSCQSVGGFFFVFGEFLDLFGCRNIWQCWDVYPFMFAILKKRYKVENLEKLKYFRTKI